MTIHDLLSLIDRLDKKPDLLVSKSPDELSALRNDIRPYLSPLGTTSFALSAALSGLPIDATKSKLIALLDQIDKVVFERDAGAKPWELGSGENRPTSKIFISKADGKRTNFFRVIDALWELSYFQNEGGQVVSRGEVLEALGQLFNDDFRSAASLLSGSNIKTSQEAATKIFDDLKAKAVQKWDEAQEKRDKKEEKQNK